jgi:hypothetical protein
MSLNPWYRDILVYLQTLNFPTFASHDEYHHIGHQAKNYLILEDTLYHRGVDCILFWCVTHEELEIMINDCNTRACGIHLSGLATTQNILRAGYFWMTLIKDCVESFNKCHPCQIFSQKISVTHDFGHHDDVWMMVYAGSSLELFPEKSYLHLFPEITFLRTVCRLLVYLPVRMHDSRRLP